jgi:hypothetical protein
VTVERARELSPNLVVVVLGSGEDPGRAQQDATDRDEPGVPFGLDLILSAGTSRTDEKRDRDQFCSGLDFVLLQQLSSEHDEVLADLSFVTVPLPDVDEPLHCPFETALVLWRSARPRAS